MIDFDVKKFLSLPVNDGSAYISEDGCGCLKGNALRAMVIEDLGQWDNALIDTASSPIPQVVSCEVDNFHRCDPLLAKILDRGEIIHCGYFYHHHSYTKNSPATIRKYSSFGMTRGNGRPQYAKLFLLRCLRRFGYIPQESVTKELITA